MSISYKPLWKLAIDKEINKTTLRDMANISNQTLSKLSKDEYVSLEIIDRICSCLDCNIEEVIMHIKDEEEIYD